jgi:hypothetical protein
MKQKIEFFLKKRFIITSILIYMISLSIYTCVSYKRVLKSSKNNHFSYLATSYINGQLSMTTMVPHGNDWSKVDIITLKNGNIYKGTWWFSKGKNIFRTLKGKFIKIKPLEIKKRERKWYVSFPPAPAVLMIPFVKIWGLSFNDVLFTLLFAALNPLLLWFLLIRLKKKKYISRSYSQILLLVILFGFGTVHFFSSVRGEVWFTAHILGISFLLLYLLSLFYKKPFLAGLFLSIAVLTRTTMVFAVLLYPIILFQRSNGIKIRKNWKPLSLFFIPLIFFGIGMMVINYLRFQNVLEFGHNYLYIRWRFRIEKYGLFNYEYLSRNLSVVFTLLPRIKSSFPYIQISPHGMALWLTTPTFLYLFWQKKSDLKIENNLRVPLMAVILPMFLTVLLYQNSGFIQFGYRFSLDFTIFLMILLAIDKRKWSKLFYSTVFFAICMNLFGAITFSRFRAFYPPGGFLFFTR